MSHSVPPQHARRKPNWQQILGAALVTCGLVFAVFAIVALSKPNGAAEKADGQASVAGTGTPPPPVTDPSTSASAPAASSTASSATPTASASGSGPAATPSGASNESTRTASVVILNNTNVTGLAARAKTDLQNAGWTVTDATNYSNDIISTAAYYDPSDPANQQAALALQRQFPWIKRVVARFPQLPASPIVLILTASY